MSFKDEFVSDFCDKIDDAFSPDGFSKIFADWSDKERGQFFNVLVEQGPFDWAAIREHCSGAALDMLTDMAPEDES